MNSSENQKVLSVSIPTWNRGILLEKLLKNLTEQITKHKLEDKIEIRVSDNFSSDDTKTICEKFTSKYDYIYYTNNGINIGLGPNVVKSISLAHGKYTLLLGDDDRLNDNSLPVLVKFLEENPDTGILVDTAYSKIQKQENTTSVSLTEFLEKYYWYMGNAGMFVMLTEYIRLNDNNRLFDKVSFSWPQTQLMILGSYQNPHNKIQLVNFNLVSETEHGNVTLYNSYYIWKVCYYELTWDMVCIKHLLSEDVANAAKKYFSHQSKQMFYNMLQCGVFIDDKETKIKTKDHIIKHLHLFSPKEKFLLYIVIFALSIPAPVSRAVSDIFIFLTRGPKGLKKKNDFVKQEKKKLEIYKGKNKTIIREFSFEGST